MQFTITGTGYFADMQAICKQTIHDKAQVSNLIGRFYSVTADLKTNVVYFGKLLASTEQDELHLVAV